MALLKKTLASIMNLYLSLFSIPASVAKRIKTKFCNFLWNDSKKHHRYHLVDWNVICNPLQCHDLDLRSIKHHNKVFLTKWLWRFGVEGGNFWCTVVVARFGELLC